MEDHIVEVSMYLSAIVGMILVSAFLIKKMNKSGFKAQGPIKIVASLSLGIKEKLVLVQVGDRQQILLGVSPERIENIQTFDQPIVFEEKRDLGGFQEKLQEIMKHSQT